MLLYKIYDILNYIVNYDNININKTAVIKINGVDKNVKLNDIETLNIIDDIAPYTYLSNLSLMFLVFKIELDEMVNEYVLTEININGSYFPIGNIKIKKSEYDYFEDSGMKFSHNIYDESEEVLLTKENIEILSINDGWNQFSSKTFQSGNNHRIVVHYGTNDTIYFYTKINYIINIKDSGEIKNYMIKNTKSKIEPRISVLLKYAKEVK